jgi:hypothetical protein
LPDLAGWLSKTETPQLVVVDTLGAATGGKDLSERHLKLLVDMGRMRECPLLLLTHTRTLSGLDFPILGSAAHIALAEVNLNLRPWRTWLELAIREHGYAERCFCLDKSENRLEFRQKID